MVTATSDLVSAELEAGAITPRTRPRRHRTLWFRGYEAAGFVERIPREIDVLGGSS